MSKWLLAASGVAIAFVGTYSVQQLEAQGPIREGARRTGQALAEGTEAVVEGTRRVVRGTAEVATGGRLEGRETRYDAQGRPYYVESEPRIADQQYDAAGQPIYTDEQRREAGYRGTEDQSGQLMHSQVFHDRCGRPFICENGRRVYIEEHASNEQAMEHEARKPVLSDENQPEVAHSRTMQRDETARPTAREEATEYGAPPLPDGATQPALDSPTSGGPNANPANPGKSNIPGQQPGDNADSSTTN